MRKLLPSPIVKGVARWAKKQPFIWNGVYESFDQVLALGDGFASDVWLSDTERYTRRALRHVANGREGIPENVPQYHALLSLLVASFPSIDRPVRVLDFGGGMGIGFANLLQCASGKATLEYLVIDNEQSCARGRELFRDFPAIRFMPTLPQECGTVDVLVLHSVLQFVENYEELLAKLASLTPTLWMFTFVPAGDIPTFASAQLNVPGSVLPVWFFNLNELIDKVERVGYRLIFKSVLDRVFDMSNFPLTHQLSRQCNLLFRRQALPENFHLVTSDATSFSRAKTQRRKENL